jgi:CubicO group peptidase (beta-lactamase class C family)
MLKTRIFFLFLLLFILVWNLHPAKNRINLAQVLPVNLIFRNDAETDSSSVALDSLLAGIRQNQSFNGNILIAQKGKILAREAIGFSDFLSHDTLHIDHAFQLASVSKQFTGLSVLMLAEQGKLALDDSLSWYYPGFPYRGITLRHLLNHRSGLPNYIYLCDKYREECPPELDNQELMAFLTEKNAPAHFKPGKRFQYSNTGYTVLAAVVEKISGQSFAEFVEENIFYPTGMEATYLPDFEQEFSGEDVARGFNRKKHPAGFTVFDRVGGDKGIYSTIDDLYLYDQALYSGELIKSETWQSLLTSAAKTNRRNQMYAFGWRISHDRNGEPYFWHAGWWEGYKTFFLRRPSDRTTIIVLSNLVKGSYIDTSEILDLLTAHKTKILAGKATMESADNSD